MVTTNTETKRQGKSSGGKRKKKRGEREAADQQPADSGVAASESRPDAEEPRPRRSLAVGGRAAIGRIRGLAEESESPDVRRQLRRLARQIEQGRGNVTQMGMSEAAIGGCLDAAETAAPRERWLLCEAAAWGLAWLAGSKRAGGSAGGLLERLVRAARAAQGPLASGETLPARFAVTLAGLFSDVDICRSLGRDALAAVRGEIARLVSAEGTVGLRGSAQTVERVARWAAIREAAVATGAPAWPDDTEKGFAAAVATAVRLLGDRGRGIVGSGRMPASFSDPLLVAAAESERKRLRRTAEAMQSKKSEKRARRRGDDAAAEKLLPRDLHDAAAATAIIRSGWCGESIRVLVQYHDPLPHIEIAVGDRLLVDGAWGWSAAADGRPLEAEGPWKLSCFESDKKATFLEIVAPLSDGLQLERQFVLLPHDRILLLADAITRRAGEKSAGLPFGREGLRLASLVPLAPGLEGKPAEETRELFVSDTKPRIMVLPLGLPEWRSAGTGGVEATVDGLVLEQRSAGSRLYAPLWLDLDPERHGRPLTWRQLTVADTRQNLPPHQAVGFRVQSGLEQWLVYRSLDEPRNRTVLGCNLSCDFVIGPIGKTGVVERAIEID
jgi:hypothetical protein